LLFAELVFCAVKQGIAVALQTPAAPHGFDLFFLFIPAMVVTTASLEDVPEWGRGPCSVQGKDQGNRETGSLVLSDLA
jgi:hypothetical protein